MASLFSVSVDAVSSLSPSSFQDQHIEDDLQRWADLNPHFINDGVPMISLGREITTKFGHYIDNLFIDGNGCIVIAEMKRGKTPRDVTGQLLDYAIFAKELGPVEIEGFCHARHGEDLETVFKRTFGIAPPDGTPCDHRLLVVAEDYDERTIEHCLYMTEQGTPVACLQFTYYQVGDNTILETQIIVGEIPDQSVKPSEGATNPFEGRFQWLFSQLSDRVGTFATNQGWQPKIAVSKWSLSFSPLSWPDHHWKRAFFVSRRSNEKVLDVGFWYHTPAYPDMRAFIEEHREAYGAIPEFVYRSSQKTLYLTFHQFPLPEIGDDDKVREIAGCAEEMAEGFLPIVSAYFNQSRESRSETIPEKPVSLEANSKEHSNYPDSEAL